jgi:hypothetical protein
MWYTLDENHNILRAGTYPVDKDWGRIVGKTMIGETLVSTVFLGLDHGYGQHASPVLFETMVFGPADPNQYIQERYCTWDEALKGHEEIVSMLREKEKCE